MSEGPVATAYVEVKPDTAGFPAELRREIDRAMAGVRASVRTGVRDVNQQFRSMSTGAGNEFARIRKDADNTGINIGNTLKRAAAVAAAAFAAVQIGQFFANAVNQASDLGESINAIQVVLKEGAGSFLAFGETAATSLGITQAALNEAITPTAALLTQAGSSGENLSAQLQQLATRATDVGSVFNKDVNQVLGAFGSALRGETEPIRAFGVQLNEQAIAAKAVALGYADSVTAVSQAAKTQAAYALILEQTNVAQGDFQNTITSLPNLIKVMKAQFDTLSADLGSALIPALQSIIQGIQPIIAGLGPLFTQMGAIIGDTLLALQPAIGPLVIAFSALFTAVAPLLPVLAQLVSAAIVPLSAVVVVLADALAPLIVTFSTLISGVLVALQPLFPPLIAAFTQVASVIGAELNAALIELSPALLQVVQALVPLIPTLLQTFMVIVPLIPPMVQLAAVILSVLLPAIAAILPVFTALANGIGGVFSSVIGRVIGFINVLIEAATSAINTAIDLYNKIPFLGDLDKAGGGAAPTGGFTGMGTGGAMQRAQASSLPTLAAVPGAISVPSAVSAGAVKANQKAAADLKKALADVRKQLNQIGKATADQSVDDIKREFDALAKGLKDAGASEFVKGIRKVEQTLVRLAVHRDKLNEQLKDAISNLASLKDESASFADSIRASVNDLGNISKESAGIGQTFTGIRNQMLAAIGTSQQFSQAIRSLSAAGLNQDSLRQLLEAGPEQGLTAARALLSGGAAGISEINSLQAQLDSVGKSLGISVADTFYGAGISAAQGLVAGLQSQEAAIEAQMNRIGDRLVKQLKRALKIQSPSLVLANEIGKPAGQGIIKGLVASLDGAGGAGSQSVRSYAQNVTFGPGSVVAHGATEAGAARMGNGLGYGIADVIERQMAQAVLNGHG